MNESLQSIRKMIFKMQKIRMRKELKIVMDNRYLCTLKENKLINNNLIGTFANNGSISTLFSLN